MTQWRYIAERLNGDGTSSIIHPDVPLGAPEITNVLSGPNAMRANITPEALGLVGPDGAPVLKKWSTAIWAEAGGEIRGGGIVDEITKDGPQLSLSCVGFNGYPAGMPFTDSWFGVQVDPLDVVRKIWDHLQSQPRGNLGFVIDRTTKTPLKIGTKLAQVQFDTQNGPVSFESGPVTLYWWQTDNLGNEIDNLAKENHFDFRERHQWAGEAIGHYLDFGYPALGRRRDDLRFVLGENVTVPPPRKSTGDTYANETLALGAGEGRTMVRGSASVNDGGLRRVATVVDKQRRTASSIMAYAKEQLGLRSGLDRVEEIVVRDSDNAPLGSWVEGDEILLQAHGAEWGDYEVWVRILATTIRPESGDVASLAVARTDVISA